MSTLRNALGATFTRQSAEASAISSTPFFRMDSSRSSTTGGSGLGLAIVQQLCQAHGWQIGIDTAPGGGTLVWLRFAE